MQWFVGNQHPDGTWLYQYDRQTDREVTTEATTSFATPGRSWASTRRRRPASPMRWRPPTAASRGPADRLVDHDGWTTLAEARPHRSAARALLAAGLVERRLLTGDTRDDDLMRALGRFLAAMTEPAAP